MVPEELVVLASPLVEDESAAVAVVAAVLVAAAQCKQFAVGAEAATEWYDVVEVVPEQA